MIDFSEREVEILNDGLRALFSETVASVSKEKNAGKYTPVEDAYIEEIKLLMGRLSNKEEASVSDIGTRIQLIDDLLKTDLEICAYGLWGQ